MSAAAPHLEPTPLVCGRCNGVGHFGHVHPSGDVPETCFDQCGFTNLPCNCRDGFLLCASFGCPELATILEEGDPTCRAGVHGSEVLDPEVCIACGKPAPKGAPDAATIFGDRIHIACGAAAEREAARLQLDTIQEKRNRARRRRAS